MDVEEFVRRLKVDQTQEKKFAFFLGAGCSVSSGIPAAGTLVNERWIPRLRDLREPHEADHLSWAERWLPGFKRDDPAQSYGRLIDELFVTADDRQREIESLCDGRSPAFGYAVLAQLVASAGSRFNVVLTTNFDDLVADALYLFTESRPLVIQHESLAAFIRPTRTRPLVVKLHGDHRLAPRNTALETEALAAEISRHTAMVLNDRGVIFMGYGGNDKGILKLLRELPVDALPSGAYWVHPEQPAGGIRDWLATRRGVWVKSGWFDEVMLLARNAFDLPHPQPDRLTKVFVDYQGAFQALSAAIAAKAAAEPGADVLKNAVKEAEKSFPDFWGALNEARRLEKTDRTSAEETYKAAIDQFPSAVKLHTFYGLFLEEDESRRTEAELWHKKATELEPPDAFAFTSYARYLESTPERTNEAEPYHRRATELDPKGPYTLVWYATFLEKIPERQVDSESFYRRAIDADPNFSFALTRYASFLTHSKDKQQEAEALFRRAIAADPKYAYAAARYAMFLDSLATRSAEAEALYRRAIELKPEETYPRKRFAEFLRRIPGREAEADEIHPLPPDSVP